MVKVGINGFGRIGRMVLRAGFDDPNIEFVAVNDLTDTKTLAHLLQYDSVHGKFNHEVHHDENALWIDGKPLVVHAERDPENLPWGDHEVDIVIESTGFFPTKEGAEKHIRAGAKKVIISAPAKGGGVKTIVMGINQDAYDPNNDHVISNASCTTNCLAPLMKVLNDNFGIEAGFFNTVHSYTGDQRHVDGPHKDLRRARACAMNIVPTSSGAAIAASLAIPELAGKVTGMAMRVPTPDGSITDFTCRLRSPTDANHINWLFQQVAEHHLQGIVEFTNKPIVSTDIIGNSHSVIFDSLSTQVVDGVNVRVVGWYDNEWGYSNRCIDLIRFISR